MGKKKHKRPTAKGLFCATRTKKCKCGNKYISNARNKAGAWSSYSFPRSAWYKKTKIIKVFAKKPEAHHILCCGSVQVYIVGNTKIDPIVCETKWCINDKPNMIPMPLWGHTVKHYCSFAPEIDTHTGEMRNKPTRPKFHNVCQHNVDHNGKGSYKFETDERMRYLAQQIAMAQKVHEIDPKDVKAELDDLSKDFQTKLRHRARRSGGTHKAWLQAMKDHAADRTNDDWYLPFSMAATGNVRKRSFPGRVDDRIRRIALAILLGG